MADESGSAAGQTTQQVTTQAAGTTKKFASPSIDIVKTVPGVVELVQRVLGAVLALVVIITAAACQGFLVEWLGSQVSQTNIYSAAGWAIFLSFWVMLYQITTIVQLFVRVQFLYTTKIPCGNWSLFSLLDIIAIGIAVGGYFCGALPMASYTAQLNEFGSDADKSKSAAGAATAFSFSALFLFSGMIIYFCIARYALKWSTHGETPPAESDSMAEK